MTKAGYAAIVQGNSDEKKAIVSNRVASIKIGPNYTNLINGFLAMLLGHNRPIHELLNPQQKDQSEVFEKEFSGMTDTDFSYQDHVRIFRELVRFVQNGIQSYRKFLLDFVSLNSDLSFASIPNLDRLPAIRWKLHNLERLKKKRS